MMFQTTKRTWVVLAAISLFGISIPSWGEDPPIPKDPFTFSFRDAKAKEAWLKRQIGLRGDLYRMEYGYLDEALKNQIPKFDPNKLKVLEGEFQKLLSPPKLRIFSGDSSPASPIVRTNPVPGKVRIDELEAKIGGLSELKDEFYKFEIGAIDESHNLEEELSQLKAEIAKIRADRVASGELTETVSFKRRLAEVQSKIAELGRRMAVADRAAGDAAVLRLAASEGIDVGLVELDIAEATINEAAERTTAIIEALAHRAGSPIPHVLLKPVRRPFPSSVLLGYADVLPIAYQLLTEEIEAAKRANGKVVTTNFILDPSKSVSPATVGIDIAKKSTQEEENYRNARKADEAAGEAAGMRDGGYFLYYLLKLNPFGP